MIVELAVRLGAFEKPMEACFELDSGKTLTSLATSSYLLYLPFRLPASCSLSLEANLPLSHTQAASSTDSN